MIPYLRESLWLDAEKLGIKRVDSRAEADYVMTSEHELDPDRHEHDRLIVIDCSDGCHFSGKIAWVDKPNVAAWAKRYRIEQQPTYDEGLPSCYFYQDLDAGIPPTGEWRIEPNQLHKVVTGLGYLFLDQMMFRHRRYSELRPRGTDRDIDIFFAGTTNYLKGDIPTWKEKAISAHRQNCVSRIRQIEGVNSVVVEDKGLHFDDYVRHLYRSKVVVSPWGYGESTYRDYEPLFYDCDVLKPKTEYRMLSCPDIYTPDDNDYLHWVRPDFEDLDITVRRLLATWEERKEARLEVKRRLQDFHSFEFQAAQLEVIVKHANQVSQFHHDACSVAY